MTPKQLNDKLDDEIRSFSEEMIFLVDTHEGAYLTSGDMEDMARQVYYSMNQFRKTIIEYAKSR